MKFEVSVGRTVRNEANSPAGECRETGDWLRLYKRACETLLATSIAAVRSEKRVWSPAFRRLQDCVNAELRTGRASAGGRRAKRSQLGRVPSVKFEVSSEADLAKRSQFAG